MKVRARQLAFLSSRTKINGSVKDTIVVKFKVKGIEEQVQFRSEKAFYEFNRLQGPLRDSRGDKYYDFSVLQDKLKEDRNTMFYVGEDDVNIQNLETPSSINRAFKEKARQCLKQHLSTPKFLKRKEIVLVVLPEIAGQSPPDAIYQVSDTSYYVLQAKTTLNTDALNQLERHCERVASIHPVCLVQGVLIANCLKENDKEVEELKEKIKAKGYWLGYPCGSDLIIEDSH